MGKDATGVAHNAAHIPSSPVAILLADRGAYYAYLSLCEKFREPKTG